MSPGNSHAEKNCRFFLLTHYYKCAIVISIIVFGFLGALPPGPLTGLCPWNPLGDPRTPCFCPPLKQIPGYAPVCTCLTARAFVRAFFSFVVARCSLLCSGVVVEHSGVCYDSGHGFEQCDFTNSPMSEYGPLGERIDSYAFYALLFCCLLLK